MHMSIQARFKAHRFAHESLLLSVILAFSGGYQDAYTYIVRDHVFANAQTGNIVLMSTHFLSGNWHLIGRYLLPVAAFAGGVFFADVLACKHTKRFVKTWHQSVLISEMIILFVVGIIPKELNVIANMLVSFSCAMQVETFRQVNGNQYASTMCIGNLRSGTSALSRYILHKDRDGLRKSFDYFFVILIFAIGAGIGGNLCDDLGIYGIWVCLPILWICFIMLKEDKRL